MSNKEYLLPKSTADCINYFFRMSVTDFFLAPNTEMDICKGLINSCKFLKVYYMYLLFLLLCLFSYLIAWLYFCLSVRLRCLWTAFPCLVYKREDIFFDLVKTYYFQKMLRTICTKAKLR